MSPRAAERLAIAGPAGPLEVAVNVPGEAPVGLALVAHPHPQQGGTLDNKVVQTLARAFMEVGWASLRFNFRGVGGSVRTTFRFCRASTSMAARGSVCSGFFLAFMMSGSFT